MLININLHIIAATFTYKIDHIFSNLPKSDINSAKEAFGPWLTQSMAEQAKPCTNSAAGAP